MIKPQPDCIYSPGETRVYYLPGIQKLYRVQKGTAHLADYCINSHLGAQHPLVMDSVRASLMCAARQDNNIILYYFDLPAVETAAGGNDKWLRGRRRF